MTTTTRTAQPYHGALSHFIEVTDADGRFVAFIGGWGHNISAQAVREMILFPELLAALKSARDSMINALDYMDARQHYDDHPLKPMMHSARLLADAAIATTEGR